MARELDRFASISAVYKGGGFVFDMLVTENPRMQQCLKLARQAAGNDLTVLVTGESGTGKNLMAQAIHNASRRKHGRCLVVNCSAFSETLLESELFGHEKGAFTGADSVRKGCFEMADGGTLVLDEVGDMSMPAQAKILQAVEYKQFMRLGGHETLSSDVRIIALTNRTLPDRVAAGQFRQDLYYRLREVHIELVPLRERPEDVPIISEVFIGECRGKLGKSVARISPAAAELLKRYSWPGNSRELRAVIRNAVLVCDGEELLPEHLSLRVEARVPGEPTATAAPQNLSLRGAEIRQIKRVLELTGGNKRRACEMLAISRPTLDRKLKDYDINAELFHAPKDDDD